LFVLPANSICRFTVFVYIVYSLICSFICNFSVYVLCTVSLRNKDIIITLGTLNIEILGGPGWLNELGSWIT
jgi:hypothetical protein